jgi:hypothetical protein
MKDAAFAVNEPKFAVRDHADFKHPLAVSAGRDELVQGLESLLGGMPVDVYQTREARLVPDEAEQFCFQFFSARAGGHPHRLDVFGRNVGVANDAHLAHLLKFVRCDIQ